MIIFTNCSITCQGLLGIRLLTTSWLIIRGLFMFCDGCLKVFRTECLIFTTPFQYCQDFIITNQINIIRFFTSTNFYIICQVSFHVHCLTFTWWIIWRLLWFCVGCLLSCFIKVPAGVCLVISTPFWCRQNVTLTNHTSVISFTGCAIRS